MKPKTQTSHRIIQARAPIRICDNGGWTDTWFARYGAVFNIAVSPCAEVQIEAFPRSDRGQSITLSVENYGDHYTLHLDQPGWERHPLLEAVIKYIGIPEDLAVCIRLFSEAPSGASTGTSAAVSVALIGGLYFLKHGLRMNSHQAATAAHTVETQLLGRQSGIQDQLCSAYGGINLIRMEKYPQSQVFQLQLPQALRWELERRLALVYLGKSHDSSRVHEKVIAGLQEAGPDCPQLEDLRKAALISQEALSRGDFAGLGQAMCENTQAQERLHPDLIGSDARRVMEIARAHGALGWKVNGAGGEGGSLTLLCGQDDSAKRAMLHEIQVANPNFRVIPIRLDPHGLRVWESGPEMAQPGQ